MSDLIDRQSAIEAVHQEFDDCLVWDESGETTASEVERILYELPSAESRPKGEWIFGETNGHSWMKCSNCLVSQSGQNATFTYCPNCGAEMRGEDDGKHEPE